MVAAISQDVVPSVNSKLDHLPLLVARNANKPPSSSEIIAAEIIKGIYNGRYSPGHRLVETDLMRQYGFSRSSVREALRHLASEGIVSWSLHKGASIRLLTRKSTRDILLLAEVLMGLSARLSAMNIGVGNNRQIFREDFDYMMSFQNGGDFYQATIARDRFFHMLANVSGNAELRRVLPFAQVQIARVQIPSSVVELRRYDEYAAIGKAILEGKPALAEARMRRHVRGIIVSFETLPDENFGPED